MRLEQMKEKKEKNYKIKRNTILKEYLKKQKEIEKQLYKTRVSRQSDKQMNNTKLMHNKEEQAKEKRRKKIERDERERLEIENKLFSKSKTIKYIIINIQWAL